MRQLTTGRSDALRREHVGPVRTMGVAILYVARTLPRTRAQTDRQAAGEAHAQSFEEDPLPAVGLDEMANDSPHQAARSPAPMRAPSQV